MSKHTPGPWEVEYLDGEYVTDSWRALHITPARGGRSVASVWPQRSTSRGVPEIQAEDEANAALIAAAPEMLELLCDLAPEDCEIDGEEIGAEQCKHCRILNVIARAEGRK